MRIRKRKRQWQSAHSATAGYPACSLELQGPDGESARIGMASPLITFISPSDTAGPSALNSYVYVYVYVVPNLNATRTYGDAAAVAHLLAIAKRL